MCTQASSPKTIALLRSMPKSELHIHIEGTLEPELALQLADRNGVQLPWNTLEELAAQYQFTDLQSFLNLYYELMSVLRTADDFRDLMLAYLERAHTDGVVHAEIFFDPQVHLNNGIAYDTVLDGLLEGLRIGQERYHIGGGLILCIVRDLPVQSAQHILDLATPRAHELLGIGLDSAEVGYPPSLFTDIFAQARALGLHCVAHAGEEGSVEYIEQALDLLHAERIDHGAHAIDDSAMMHRLANDQIPVTRCPLSNLRLHVVDNIHELQLSAFLDAGIITTINSDDPAYFGGYILENYCALADAGMSVSKLVDMGRMSLMAVFGDDEYKNALLCQFDDWKQSAIIE